MQQLHLNVACNMGGRLLGHRPNIDGECSGNTDYCHLCKNGG
jgi:hypothetical protein